MESMMTAMVTSTNKARRSWALDTIGFWILSTLSIAIHGTAAWGFYQAQLSPTGWHWERQAIPSHGFIDSEAVRQADQWVLSHHDRWSSPDLELLSLEAQLSDGAQLTLAEGLDAIQLICESGQIRIKGSSPSISCMPEFITTANCRIVGEWRPLESGLGWTINAQDGSCSFLKETERHSSVFKLDLQSGVRPIWISTLNQQSVFTWRMPVFIIILTGSLLWWTRKLFWMRSLSIAGLLSLVVPFFSPEYVAVLFRAPAWNHWGLGFYLMLLLVGAGLLMQYSKSAFSWRMGIVTAATAVLFSLGTGNDNLLSCVSFAGLGLALWWAVRSLALKSGWQTVLALVAAVFTLELGTRQTDTGQRWLRDMGYAQATMAALSGEEQRRLLELKTEYERFERAQFQDYPSTAFPVRFDPKSDRLRLVAMGGSSTGGAYQMDDLSQFYPAQLERHFEHRYEVVNQGVGGWTSYHIRRYLEQYFEALQPDILTLYISNNDAAKQLPADIESVYDRLDTPSPKPPWLSLLGPLSSVHRLVWLSERVEAVPIEKMGHNIARIAALFPDDKRRILLMTELNYPNSKRLQHHHQRLAAMAEQIEGVAFWDGRDKIEGQDELFLDQVHLSEAGHEWLSQQLAERLVELGWLP